jgi:hypothetical protein
VTLFRSEPRRDVEGKMKLTTRTRSGDGLNESSQRVNWEDEKVAKWTGDLTRGEGSRSSCRTGAEPNHEIVKGRYLKHQENGR